MSHADLPRADAILALWGVTAGRETALDENVSLALAAQNLALNMGAKRVLHCSSMAIYPPGTTLKESTPAAPSTSYGQSKLRMERAVAQWHRQHPQGPASCLMRIGNIAGADSLFEAMKDSDSVTLDRFATGHSPRRSYISPTVFVRVLVGLLEVPVLPDCLNIAGNTSFEMHELTRAAGRAINWKTAPDDSIPEVTLCTELLSNTLPGVDLDDTAQDVIDGARASGVWA
jgi:nucleoside-diphosphate-sugar epimerase